MKRKQIVLWLRSGGRFSRRNLWIILWDNHKFSGQMGTTRFLMNFLPPEKRPEQVIAFQQGRLKVAYGILNDHLATRDWVASPGPSIADFSLCGYLYYPEPFGFDRADWPYIARWLDRIAALLPVLEEA